MDGLNAYSNSDVQLIMTKPNNQPTNQIKTPKIISINIFPEPQKGNNYTYKGERAGIPPMTLTNMLHLLRKHTKTNHLHGRTLSMEVVWHLFA